MATTKLTPAESTLLTSAAQRHRGTVIVPDTMKPTTAKRMIAKLLKLGLIAERTQDGAVDHHLTPTGYEAVGIEPPRAEAPATKGALIKTMLGRCEGASLTELIAATGWQPHTTRAALSRLRSAGEILEKRTREDGTTAYRLPAVEPTLRLTRPPVVPADAAPAPVAAA